MDVTVVLLTEANRLAKLQGLGYSALGISSGISTVSVCVPCESQPCMDVYPKTSQGKVSRTYCAEKQCHA